MSCTENSARLLLEYRLKTVVPVNNNTTSPNLTTFPYISKVEITPDREVGTIIFGAVGAMGTAAAAAVCNRDS